MCDVYLVFNLTKHLNVSFSFTKVKLHLPQIGNKYAGIAFQIVVLVLCTEVTLFSFSNPGNTRHVIWKGICRVTDVLRDVKEGVRRENIFVPENPGSRPVEEATGKRTLIWGDGSSQGYTWQRVTKAQIWVSADYMAG